MAVKSSTLSVFTNENGGIIDDTVINKQSDDAFYVVSNGFLTRIDTLILVAGCADKDLAHIRAQLKKFKGDAKVEVLDHLSLVALQGPSAAKVVEGLCGQSLAKMPFMSGQFLKLDGITAYVSRCGYTGEDGFEVLFSPLIYRFLFLIIMQFL